MKCFLFIALALGIFFGPVFSQVSPFPGRLVELDVQKINNETRKKILREIKEFYRVPTAAELSVVAVREETVEKHKDFLKQPDSGIIRLVPDYGCDVFSQKNADAEICKKFSMPGGGSAYSFRKNTYQFWQLADLLYNGKSFYSLGQMSQGFLVKLGNVPLEKVTLETAGAGYVADLVPASDIDGAIGQNKKFTEGVKSGVFFYSKALPAEENATYILRSIAYRGKIRRIYKKVEFNELDFDERKDVIVAFQVVEKADDGSVTILWKQLRQQDSSKLKD